MTGRNLPTVRPSWLIPLGCWLGLSVIVWSLTDATAHTCRNALVGALASSSCTTATMWHDLATFSGLAALVLLGLAARRLYAQARASS
jgi:hypothetical protein